MRTGLNGVCEFCGAQRQLRWIAGQIVYTCGREYEDARHPQVRTYTSDSTVTIRATEKDPA